MLSTARGIKKIIVTKTVWVLPFYDYNTINVKGIEEIFTDIAI